MIRRQVVRINLFYLICVRANLNRKKKETTMGSSQSKVDESSAQDVAHIVKIQDLPAVATAKKGRFSDGSPYDQDVKRKWSKCECRFKHARASRPPGEEKKETPPCACRVLFETQNNNAINGMRHSGNAFLDAVLGAYNNHEDLVLSPDDIWMLICLQFSKHVDENAEQLRDLFVEHQGQKQLEAITFNETKEEEWNEFFELIHDSRVGKNYSFTLF